MIGYKYYSQLKVKTMEDFFGIEINGTHSTRWAVFGRGGCVEKIIGLEVDGIKGGCDPLFFTKEEAEAYKEKICRESNHGPELALSIVVGEVLIAALDPIYYNKQ